MLFQHNCCTNVPQCYVIRTLPSLLMCDLLQVNSANWYTVPLLIPTWYTIFYINYIKLSSSKCFERHPLIFRRSMMLIVHVCSLWYSHSLQVAVLCTCTRRPPAENENTRGCIHVQLTHWGRGNLNWLNARSRGF